MSHSYLDPEHESPPGTPGWMKALGIVGLVLVLLFGLLHLTGNSPGGPGSHTMPGNHGIQAP